MPLWSGYDDDIASKVADINNVSASPFAGAIIGALFLKRFVTETRDWLHVDLYALEPARSVPAGPSAAEPQAVRALYALLVERLRLTRQRRWTSAYERRAWTLIYLCLGLIEGGTAAVMVRSLFGDAGPRRSPWTWSSRS